MHPLYEKADQLSFAVIGAAIEVHRHLGPGLIESIYERCLIHELSLRGIKCVGQMIVPITYKGITFEEPLRLDVLVEDCLVVENKCTEIVNPVHRAIKISYMRMLDAPIGLLINFHVPVLRDGIIRSILPGANQP